MIIRKVWEDKVENSEQREKERRKIVFRQMWIKKLHLPEGGKGTEIRIMYVIVPVFCQIVQSGLVTALATIPW